ncbi:hypothetical protein [Campylobacter fetus]|uniref:hypothetical protein n=1 Tax=Campylobacter fetus TaxID=196 RepID=UPI0008187F27|nr:hypothetical protein [Campylobacter fetus]OCR84619.1 hypothetical protein CFT12S05168_08930 [Campylobacter fetus subsp. testudinum]
MFKNQKRKTGRGISMEDSNINKYLRDIRYMQNNDYKAFVSAYLFNEFSYTINKNARANPNESDVDFLEFSYMKFMNTNINLCDITNATIKKWKDDYKLNQELETSIDNFKIIEQDIER